MRRRRVIVVRPGMRGGLGAYAPAETQTIQLQYLHPAAPPPPPAPSAQPAIVPPPSSAITAPPPWIEMPPDGEPFNPLTWIAMPAVAAGVDNPVVTITVPPGRDGVITRLANMVLGVGWAQGTGDLIWKILRNGEAVRNFENVLASLGNVGNPLYLFKSGIRIYENDVVQWTLQNTALVPGGQQVGAMFGGWFYPKSHDDQGWA